jgi:transcriptional regulator with XRE-family HTH domain
LSRLSHEELTKLGERLKEIRLTQKLTQQRFADILETSVSFICEIEAGKKAPGCDLLISLKRKFNVDIDWLLEGGLDARRSKTESKSNTDVSDIVEWMNETPGAVKLLRKIVKANNDFNAAVDELKKIPFKSTI